MIAYLRSVVSTLVGLTRLGVEIIVVGLDNSGKTSILNRLTRRDVPNGVLPGTEKTIGFNTETIQHWRHSITIWDIGGQDKVRPLWGSYFWKAHAFVFVVDASAPERFSEAREELLRMPERRDIEKFPLLVVANKWDLVKDGSMTLERFRLEMGVDELEKLGMVIGIIVTSAMTGEGISGALDWIVERVPHQLINSRNEEKKHVITQW
ncbi:ADP-ribosylation factor family-domain-containing protein [Crepidotus variabilis]|uniref:ADP-ribosylation factor n=1 Tax=Crepidotus variabilis TaxID=179855 RepID=A0A9P6EAD8_9AGAR|nr:ADP-ribosylation factor family-domain-containing protein [Crepidotus variabilis]